MGNPFLTCSGKSMYHFFTLRMSEPCHSLPWEVFEPALPKASKSHGPGQSAEGAHDWKEASRYFVAFSNFLISSENHGVAEAGKGLCSSSYFGGWKKWAPRCTFGRGGLKVSGAFLNNEEWKTSVSSLSLLFQLWRTWPGCSKYY